MTKKLDLKEVLAKGTVKQKALLIIQNEEASCRQGGAFLSDTDVKSIYQSVSKNDIERRELKLYLSVSGCYMDNRFRLVGLQENLKKLSYIVAGYCQLWEKAEKEAEFCNVLLGLVDAGGKGVSTVSHKADVVKYIYQSCRSWDKYAPILRKTDEQGNELRDVEVEISPLLEYLEGIIASYKSSLGIAKAFVIASDELVAKYKASAFIPEDIKEIIKYFKSPNTIVPDIYRRDAFLKLKEAKGEEDREVVFREKYAILPAWEEIEPIGLNNARKSLSI